MLSTKFIKIVPSCKELNKLDKIRKVFDHMTSWLIHYVTNQARYKSVQVSIGIQEDRSLFQKSPVGQDNSMGASPPAHAKNLELHTPQSSGKQNPKDWVVQFTENIYTYK